MSNRWASSFLGILDLAGRMGRAAAGYGASEPALTLSIPGNGAKWVGAGSLSARVSSFGMGLKRAAAPGKSQAAQPADCLRSNQRRRRFAPLDLPGMRVSRQRQPGAARRRCDGSACPMPESGYARAGAPGMGAKGEPRHRNGCRGAGRVEGGAARLTCRRRDRTRRLHGRQQRGSVLPAGTGRNC